MGKEIKLEAQTRADEKMRDLRAEGLMPAVMYGAGNEAISLKLKTQEFKKVFTEAGESTLIDLVVDGKEAVKVIVKEIQKDRIKGDVLHVDFYVINMKNKIEVEIPLNFIGESKAVRELGGTLLKSMEAITVKCLPGELVESLDVDLSTLKSFDDTVRVSDIVLPANYEAITQASQPIATVEMPRSAKQNADADAQIAADNAAAGGAAPVAEDAEAATPATEAKTEEKK